LATGEREQATAVIRITTVSAISRHVRLIVAMFFCWR
jgi:hypothetical protein